MCISKRTCPVPFDQQPLNEFYALKDSCFFSFFGWRFSDYLYSLFIILFFLIISSIPFIFSITVYSWTRLFVTELFYVISIIALILIRLYLGWSYILDRLLSATVFYEESGWYDGQIWIKTSEILTKDRLIATYYVLPLLQRIKYTFFCLFISMLLDLLLYNLIC